MALNSNCKIYLTSAAQIFPAISYMILFFWAMYIDNRALAVAVLIMQLINTVFGFICYRIYKTIFAEHLETRIKLVDLRKDFQTLESKFKTKND